MKKWIGVCLVLISLSLLMLSNSWAMGVVLSSQDEKVADAIYEAMCLTSLFNGFNIDDIELRKELKLDIIRLVKYARWRHTKEGSKVEFIEYIKGLLKDVKDKIETDVKDWYKCYEAFYE